LNRIAPPAYPAKKIGTKSIGLGCLGILVLGIVVMALWGIGSYNTLVKLDQGVRSGWAQVENVYQRRADLVPNLVETVKGAADFERDTFTAVTEARSKVGQMKIDPGQLNDPAAFAKFQQAQDQLGGALQKLMVVVEKYPELKATQNFRDLQSQLEGTENRITVERQRFNESAQAFNTKRMSFPTVLIAGFFGSRFAEKAYFKAVEGADVAPKVDFKR
jgi:LemA protein